jgi:hypothetical protein
MTDESSGKYCPSCETWKEFSEFYKNDKKLDGYEKSCQTSRKELNKKYQQENKDKIKEYQEKYYNSEKVKHRQKNYYQNNREKISPYHQTLYLENKDDRNKQHREYYQKNEERAIQYTARYRKERRANDEEFRIVNNLRKRVF